jgi:hypothetical protein
MAAMSSKAEVGLIMLMVSKKSKSISSEPGLAILTPIYRENKSALPRKLCYEN